MPGGRGESVAQYVLQASEGCNGSDGSLIDDAIHHPSVHKVLHRCGVAKWLRKIARHQSLRELQLQRGLETSSKTIQFTLT